MVKRDYRDELVREYKEYNSEEDLNGFRGQAIADRILKEFKTMNEFERYRHSPLEPEVPSVDSKSLDNPRFEYTTSKADAMVLYCFPRGIEKAKEFLRGKNCNVDRPDIAILRVLFLRKSGLLRLCNKDRKAVNATDTSSAVHKEILEYILSH
jgi:hypothetical protein